MSSPLAQFRDQLNAFVWDADLRHLGGLQRHAVQALRIVYAVVRELISGDLNLRAMSLVYTTLLSLVPLLAVSFSVLKAFGVHNELQPALENFLSPLGDEGVELSGNIIEFVSNVQVGLLGGVGLGLLIYTVVSLLQKIEASFNHVWHVDALRSFAQRFSNYLSIVLVGPVLVFGVLGITASLMNTAFAQRITAIEPFGSLVYFGVKLSPYVLVWIAFTFMYATIPNTRVRFGPAALGGLVAGVVWQSTYWVFAVFIASSSRYTAIYSSFAILILALIWVYLNWLILLLGTQVVFYIQNPHFVTMLPVRLVLSNRLKERLGLGIMYLVGYNHYHHREPWTLHELVEELRLPTDSIGRLLTLLSGSGFLEQTAGDPPAYLPRQDIETITLRDLLRAIRGADESRFLSEDRVQVPKPVGEVMDAVSNALDGALSGATLKDLVLQQREPRPGPRAVDGAEGS
jgi:membrane protein